MACTGPTTSPGLASASASTTSEPRIWAAIGATTHGEPSSPWTAPPLAFEASSVERSTSSSNVAPLASSSMTSSAASSVGSTIWRTHTIPRAAGDSA